MSQTARAENWRRREQEGDAIPADLFGLVSCSLRRVFLFLDFDFELSKPSLSFERERARIRKWHLPISQRSYNRWFCMRLLGEY